MSTEQRRALADMIPTTEVIKDAVTYPRERLGEPLDISAERFEAWLARVRRAAKAEALREAAGDIAWSAETLPHMTPHDAARGLVRRADRIETGDQR